MLTLKIYTKHVSHSYLCRFVVETSTPETENPCVFVVKKDEDGVLTFLSVASVADMAGYGVTSSDTVPYRVSEINASFSDATVYASTIASIKKDIQENFTQQEDVFSWSESYTCNSSVNHSGDFFFE